MRGKARLILSALSSLILVPAVWALPTAHGSASRGAVDEQAASKTQSVSGKIAAVQTDSFTLTVAAGISGGEHLLQQKAAPKTMMFMIDKNTTIDGTLQVGANADVTYREDNGKNLAISVRVTP